jgi:hypothetical protein
MSAYDVIVVRGGVPGGLPVAVIEARPELGNFCPTHETWPGTLDSPQASINLTAAVDGSPRRTAGR